MDIKIEKFQCENCGIKIKSYKILTYTCPNCGGLLEPEDDIYCNRLNDEINKIDEDNINTTKNKVETIKKLTKNNQLKKISKIILKMIDILFDNNVAFYPKAIIAAAFVYLLNPLDLIPDAIPGFGFSDDAAIIMIAFGYIVKLTDDALKVYNIRKLHNYQLSPIIYSVTYDNTYASYNFIEENQRRIWVLNPSELKKYGLKQVDDVLVKVPENYINHPYLHKTLVPIYKFDNTLAEHMMYEQVNFARMLGAKKIVLKIKEYEEKKRSGSHNGNVNVNRTKSNYDIDVVKARTNYREISYEDEYSSFEEINTDYIKKFVWCFTNNDGLYRDLILQRFSNDVSSKKMMVQFETNTLLDAKTRFDLMKSNNFNLHIKFSKVVKRDIEVKIEFFEMPEHLRGEKSDIYNKLTKLMEERRKELDAYSMYISGNANIENVN